MLRQLGGYCYDNYYLYELPFWNKSKGIQRQLETERETERKRKVIENFIKYKKIGFEQPLIDNSYCYCTIQSKQNWSKGNSAPAVSYKFNAQMYWIYVSISSHSLQLSLSSPRDLLDYLSLFASEVLPVAHKLCGDAERDVSFMTRSRDMT